jgi:ankyrin repeat protein
MKGATCSVDDLVCALREALPKDDAPWAAELLSAPLPAGFFWDALDGQGFSLAMRAARLGAVKCLRVFLEAGASPDVRGFGGASAVHCATGPCLLALLGAGANVDARDDQERSPLSIAAETGRVDDLLALVQAGARVVLPDANGWTPAHWAARRGQVKCLEALAASGAWMAAPEEDGRRPLDLAHGEALAFLAALQEREELREQALPQSEPSERKTVRI